MHDEACDLVHHQQWTLYLVFYLAARLFLTLRTAAGLGEMIRDDGDGWITRKDAPVVFNWNTCESVALVGLHIASTADVARFPIMPKSLRPESSSRASESQRRSEQAAALRRWM